MSKAEKFIQEHTKNCSNLAHLDDLNGNVWEENTPWLTPDQARKAVEIAREEMIEKAVEWIDINCVHYLDIDVRGTLTANVRQLIKDLKQAIEDE